jgi:hypothetical protein
MSTISIPRMARVWLLAVALLAALPALRGQTVHAGPPTDPTGVSVTQVNTLDLTIVYAEPSEDSEKTATLEVNSTAYLVAKRRTSSGWWFQIAEEDGEVLGWVPMHAVEVISVTGGDRPNAVDDPNFVPITILEPSAPLPPDSPPETIP